MQESHAEAWIRIPCPGTRWGRTRGRPGGKPEIGIEVSPAPPRHLSGLV